MLSGLVIERLAPNLEYTPAVEIKVAPLTTQGRLTETACKELGKIRHHAAFEVPSLVNAGSGAFEYGSILRQDFQFFLPE